MRKPSLVFVILLTFIAATAQAQTAPATQPATQPALGQYSPGQVFVAGAGEKNYSTVRLLDLEATRKDPSAVVWSWIAKDSPQIQPVHRQCFFSLNECKPVMNGEAILVTSSTQGAVALIRVKDKACLAYAKAKGAHSADLIGKDLLAVALSNEKGDLRIYRLPPAGAENVFLDDPAWKIDFPWAHSAVWDPIRQVLWAHGDKQLLKLKVKAGETISADVAGKWELPAAAGHDLCPWDDKRLAVTVGASAHLFDVEKEAFAPLPGLADSPGLKCVSRDPKTGQVIYVQADHSNRSREIGVLDGRGIPVGGHPIYKARWNQPNAFTK